MERFDRDRLALLGDQVGVERVGLDPVAALAAACRRLGGGGCSVQKAARPPVDVDVGDAFESNGGRNVDVAAGVQHTLVGRDAGGDRFEEANPIVGEPVVVSDWTKSP